MSLQFFADHCVPRSIIEDLRNGGHEVFILKEYLPTNADDSVVIAEAQTQNAILLSLNGDFYDITTYPPSNYRRGQSKGSTLPSTFILPPSTDSTCERQK